jgi:hypothetical protein
MLRAVLTPFLFCLIGIPSGLLYFGFSSSTAIGTMLVSGLALVLAFTLLKFSRWALLHAVLVLLLLLIGVFLHLFAALMQGPVDLIRGIASLFPLCISVAGGWAIAELIAKDLFFFS